MLGELLFRVYRLFISRRFAISLLIAISVLLFLGILLPNLSYHKPEEMVRFSTNHPILFELGRAFNPPTLTTSWTFLTLTGLLLLSTVLCCIERIRNREYEDPYSSQPKFFRQKIKIELAAKPPVVFKSTVLALRQHWWQLGTKRAHGEFLFLEGRKGAYGFWGSIIFHLGFIIILLGVIVSSATRFSGRLLIAEGQEVPLLVRNLIEINKKPAGAFELPGTVFYLDRFIADIRQERFPVEYTANLKLAEANGTTLSESIRVNEAIKYRDLAILLQNYGFSPRMVLKAAKGKTLVDAYINLKGRQPGSRDSFDVPKTKIKIDTVFFPNFNITTSLVPREPVYAITVKEKGTKIFKGYLRKGKSVKFNGMTLSFPDLRYWAYFQVSRDLGLGALFWGFVISFAGLLLRFLFHDRQVSIRIKSVPNGTELLVSGRSRYFPVIFKEELGRLARSIEDERTGGILSWENLKHYFSG